MSVNTANARGGEYATARRGGMTAYEIDFVREQRAKGRSVQTIANMLGRSQEAIAALIEATSVPAVCTVLKVKAPTVPPSVAMSMIELVARRHGFVASDLTGRSQQAKIAIARQEAYARLRWMQNEHGGLRFTLPQIAAWFGRDHSTVLSGVNSHARREEGKEASDLARWRRLGTAA